MNVIKKIEQLVLERNYEEALKLCNEWDMDLAKVIKHMPDEGILIEVECSYCKLFGYKTPSVVTIHDKDEQINLCDDHRNSYEIDPSADKKSPL